MFTEMFENGKYADKWPIITDNQNFKDLLVITNFIK